MSITERGLPFGIAGDWHGVPFLVFAPHLFACCMSKSMGLIR